MDFALAGDFSQLNDALLEIGGEPEPALPDGVTDIEHTLACKDATIKQLQAMLETLLPLSEELGEVEAACRAAERKAERANRELQALRDRLAATSEELEGSRHEVVSEADRERSAKAQAEIKRLKLKIRRLERRALIREGVLSRERKRHASTRQKLTERRAVASQRWNEIRRLRGQRNGHRGKR